MKHLFIVVISSLCIFKAQSAVVKDSQKIKDEIEQKAPQQTSEVQADNFNKADLEDLMYLDLLISNLLGEFEQTEQTKQTEQIEQKKMIDSEPQMINLVEDVKEPKNIRHNDQDSKELLYEFTPDELLVLLSSIFQDTEEANQHKLIQSEGIESKLSQDGEQKSGTEQNSIAPSKQQPISIYPLLVLLDALLEEQQTSEQQQETDFKHEIQPQQLKHTEQTQEQREQTLKQDINFAQIQEQQLQHNTQQQKSHQQHNGEQRAKQQFKQQEQQPEFHQNFEPNINMVQIKDQPQQQKLKEQEEQVGFPTDINMVQVQNQHEQKFKQQQHGPIESIQQHNGEENIEQKIEEESPEEIFIQIEMPLKSVVRTLARQSARGLESQTRNTVKLDPAQQVNEFFREHNKEMRKMKQATRTKVSQSELRNLQEKAMNTREMKM